MNKIQLRDFKTAYARSSIPYKSDSFVQNEHIAFSEFLKEQFQSSHNKKSLKSYLGQFATANMVDRDDEMFGTAWSHM